MLHGLERLALWFEALINKLVGNLQLNPLYHSDTLAFFLLILVGVSGLYLTVFYQFGYEASYESVARMTRFPLSHVMRGIHRYASAALMIFTLLHALRIFFLGRFRGAQRPAWIWGVVTTGVLWIAGVTGHLLLWDQRALLVVQSVLILLEPLPALAAGAASALLSEAAAEKSWLTMLLLLGLHIGLAALGGLTYWYHIRRLNRPKFFPARYWMIGIRVVFPCERHVAHGARPSLRRSPDDPVQMAGDIQVEVIPLTCAAMAHPVLLARTLKAGAAEVQVVGCLPDDCANREGNLWLEARLARQRAPKLRRVLANAPIFATWLPPNRFAEALALHPPAAAETTEPKPRAKEGEEENGLTWEWFLPAPNWHHLLLGLALAALLLILSVVLTGIPYTP